MNCHSCVHARQAGNDNLVGCAYWTEIYRGNIKALSTAIAYISQKENLGINLNNEFTDREAIGFLIDILVEDYAPKPLYNGWANMNLPCNQNKNRGEMTESCVVLNPEGSCDFYAGLVTETSEVRNLGIAIAE